MTSFVVTALQQYTGNVVSPLLPPYRESCTKRAIAILHSKSPSLQSISFHLQALFIMVGKSLLLTLLSSGGLAAAVRARANAPAAYGAPPAAYGTTSTTSTSSASATCSWLYSSTCSPVFTTKTATLSTPVTTALTTTTWKPEVYTTTVESTFVSTETSKPISYLPHINEQVALT